VRLTPLVPGDRPHRDAVPARATQAAGPLRAAVVAPPFVVLAAAAGAAAALGAALAAVLRGDWIDMHGLGHVVAWGGHALWSALFLTLDARTARRLPERTWPSRAAMWRATLGQAALALPGALGLGLLLVGVVSNLARARSSGTETAIVGTAAAVGLWIVVAAVANVRARRPTRIGVQ